MDVYQAPASEVKTEGNPYRLLVVEWEKQRLRFNLILLPLGLLALIAWSYRDPKQLMVLLPGALLFGLGANLCYLLGPLAELYSRAFFPASNPRPFLYWAGVTFSSLVVVGSGVMGLIVSSLLPNIN